MVKIKTPLVLDQQTSGVSCFISILKRMVEQGAQFIIATHSPIIMAFPNAAILSFDSARIQPVKYDDLEHVTLTKAFLNNLKLIAPEGATFCAALLCLLGLR